MILATVMFTCMISAVKYVRAEMGPFEVLIYRALVSLSLLWVIYRRRSLVIHNRRAMIVRAVLGFGAMVGFTTAAHGLSLANMSIVGKLQPLVIAVTAPWVIGASERPGRRTWLALLGGLLGASLILGPDLQVGSVYGMAALGATLSSALAHLAVRQLGKTDRAHAVVFWFHVAILCMALIGQLSIAHSVQLPAPHLWLPLVLCGVCATAGQLLLTSAYATEDSATSISAASYTAPLFGVVADLVAFGLWPDAVGILGGLLVVGAGLSLVLTRRPPAAQGQPQSPDAPCSQVMPGTLAHRPSTAAPGLDGSDLASAATKREPGR